MVFTGENIVIEHRLVLDRDIEVQAGATAETWANGEATWTSHISHGLMSEATDHQWLVLPTPVLPAEMNDTTNVGALKWRPWQEEWSDDDEAETEVSLIDFYFHPNPTSGELNLSQTLETVATVTVRDLSGRTVQGATLQAGTASFRLEVPAGLHFVELVSGGWRHIQRIVVQ
jgi:hypothetical protein